MSLDLAGLRAAVDRHGAVARVLVTETAGSVPREAGTAMLVWADGQSGTIGGGALEFQAIAAARRVLGGGRDRLDRQALGPKLAQCCGGAVTLLTERWDAARLEGIAGLAARPLPGGPETPPLAVQRVLARARNGQETPDLWTGAGWILEAVGTPRRELWVWGAGHVGRAIVAVAAPLPDLSITWLDTAPERFPADVPAGVRLLPVADLPRAVALAPTDAAHLVLTYSHVLDLDLCHALLGHGFGFAGLIGSATKWARFRSRLAALGHRPEAIGRISCPIGQPELGKHPQAIAVGVVSGLLLQQASEKEAPRTGKDRVG